MMNRIEQAASNCDLCPLEVSEHGTPVAMWIMETVVAPPTTEYVLGGIAGYADESLASGTGLLSAPSAAELLAARRA